MPDQKQSESPKLGRGLVIIILLGLLGALLFPGISPVNGRWPTAFWNLLHIPAFFVLARVLFAILPSSSPKAYQILIVAGVSIFLAAGTEWLQTFLGRSGSWKDFTLNLTGIGLAVFWFLVRKGEKTSQAAFAVVVGLTLVGGLWPGWGAAWAESRQLRSLPEIGTFSRWETRQLWRAQGNAGIKVEQGFLIVRIGEGKYGGVSFWPGAQDWSSYSHLVLELENPGELFELGVRIDDTHSELPGGAWFSSSAQVTEGESVVEVKLPVEQDQEAAINFAAVRRLALFTGEESRGREFVVKSAFLR